MSRNNAWKRLSLGARCAAIVACAGGAIAACGAEDVSVFPTEVDGGDAATTTDTGTTSDGTSFVDAGGCTTNAECNGAVCLGGACCPSNAVCETTCCASGTVCLFEQCVAPGKTCNSTNDCPTGQYCETALGTAGAADASTEGGSGADGGVTCTQPPPIGGRCVARPPLCAPAGDASADAAPASDAGACIASCEYRPTVGAFATDQRWQWGYNLGPAEFPNHVDVWSTPVVGRIYDGNCDGKVDELDSPSILFVSGDARTAQGAGTCCQCNGGPNNLTSCHRGVLRMLEGRSGKTVWSKDKAFPTSIGFAGMSIAMADIDADGRADVVAVTGEGYVVLLDDKGNTKRISDVPIAGATDSSFGWGGGLTVGDADGDGFPEIVYGRTIFSTKNNAITRVFEGAAGLGGSNNNTALSTFADLDGAVDGHRELLAGRTAYKLDAGTGTWSVLWDRTDLPDGFPAIADFDKNGKPEVVLVASGNVYLLDAATGATVLGPTVIIGGGFGGPPTVADFDGDGFPEIGVAQSNFYSVLKPNFVTSAIDLLWKQTNHDLSSSETGSTVFDFEGDGQAEVIYADECFLWVWGYDKVQAKPVVRFATPHTSFTATEASLVADVDGDGHAEIVMVSNRADPKPGSGGWDCNVAPWDAPDPVAGRPAWTPPPGQGPGTAYRGLVVFGDRTNSWVGTRTLWGQHTYHVSEICDDRDTACAAPNKYASVASSEAKNWTVPWLNNFRQNVQDKGIFDAPDATVRLTVDCVSPVIAHVSVRNIGLKGLPAGVRVGVFRTSAPTQSVGEITTTRVLAPSQTETVAVTLAAPSTKADAFVARILLDAVNPKFHQCREDNDESPPATASCTR
jgi:hypothetical protein